MKKGIFLLLLVCVQLAFAQRSYQNTVEKLGKLIASIEAEKMTVSEAIMMVDENDVELLLKRSTRADSILPTFTGFSACSGAANGVICFDSKRLEEMKNQHGSVIWVTRSISNDDLCYIKHADGILAFEEDPSSHAIIVVRVNNVPCITLPEGAKLNNAEICSDGHTLTEGDFVTVDGFNGRVLMGWETLVVPQRKDLLNLVMNWTDSFAQVDVHINGDTAQEALAGLQNGGKGIDPRSEHMFFRPESLRIFRQVILQKDQGLGALEHLKEIQRNDLFEMFSTMRGKAAKIRLLDPPLHEFLPKDAEICEELANDLGITSQELQAKVEHLAETNPMMGHRGVRLLVTFPEILRMQLQAIFEAAIDERHGAEKIVPTIIIPMVVTENEILAVKAIIEEEREKLRVTTGKEPQYKLGIMVETPRACLLADRIAKHVDYFSFGTNDLSGLTFAFSRGDVFDKFLKEYLERGLLNEDPFSELDDAVVMLMKMTVEAARKQNHYVSVGICGEQASQRSGVYVCHKLGFDSVSTAPERIPVVRLFAAQAAIEHPVPTIPKGMH